MTDGKIDWPPEQIIERLLRIVERAPDKTAIPFAIDDRETIKAAIRFISYSPALTAPSEGKT